MLESGRVKVDLSEGALKATGPLAPYRCINKNICTVLVRLWWRSFFLTRECLSTFCFSKNFNIIRAWHI